MCRDGKGEAHVHPARIVLDRGVQELLNLGEVYDLVKLALDLVALHPEDGAIQVDIVAAGQFRMKAGPDFEQRTNPPVKLSVPVGRLSDTAEDLEQCAFPAPFRPMMPTTSPRLISKETSFRAQIVWLGCAPPDRPKVERSRRSGTFAAAISDSRSVW